MKTENASGLLFPALFRERSEQFRTGQGDWGMVWKGASHVSWFWNRRCAEEIKWTETLQDCGRKRKRRGNLAGTLNAASGRLDEIWDNYFRMRAEEVGW